MQSFKITIGEYHNLKSLCTRRRIRPLLGNSLKLNIIATSSYKAIKLRLYLAQEQTRNFLCIPTPPYPRQYPTPGAPQYTVHSTQYSSSGSSVRINQILDYLWSWPFNLIHNPLIQLQVKKQWAQSILTDRSDTCTCSTDCTEFVNHRDHILHVPQHYYFNIIPRVLPTW